MDEQHDLGVGTSQEHAERQGGDTMSATRIRRRIRGSDAGANAVEYGLIIAGIAALIAVAVFAIGAISNGQFTSTCDAWRTAAADNNVCR